MATEGPFLLDGSQNTLSTTNDFRNAAITGTTLPGPSGSGQFLAVMQSTTVARTVLLPTTVQFQAYGIVQNKPAAGGAVSCCIFGVTKAVNGSTAAIPAGSPLMLSTIAFGTLIPFTTAAGVTPCGRAIENCAAGSSQSIFTVAFYGFGVGPPGGV